MVTLGGVWSIKSGRGHTTAGGRVPPVCVDSLEPVSQSAAPKRTPTTPPPRGGGDIILSTCIAIRTVQ